MMNYKDIRLDIRVVKHDGNTFICKSDLISLLRRIRNDFKEQHVIDDPANTVQQIAEFISKEVS